MRGRSWQTMSGKAVWRAGKKGVRRVQRDVSLLRTCGEVSFVSAATGVDRTRRTESRAAEHLCDFAKAWHGRDEQVRMQWQQEAKGILYEQGGEALLAHLRTLELPANASAEVREEFRKLIGYFENNRHRTDYPTYRKNGWDIGSGPTEAGCKIIGERLTGSGMRWVEDGAATVAALRALYVSGSKLWDGFWAQPHRAAA